MLGHVLDHACMQDMADARFTLLGSAKPVAEAEAAAARALFLARHAGSFWVDFGDFTWFRLDDVVQGRLVGGFARARTVRNITNIFPASAFSGIFDAAVTWLRCIAAPESKSAQRCTRQDVPSVS